MAGIDEVVVVVAVRRREGATRLESIRVGEG